MAGYVFRPTYRDKETGEKKASSVWWIGYSVNGKKYRESTKTRKKREAEDFLARRLADRGQAPLHRQLERVTFEDLCEVIRNDYSRNGRKSGERLDLSIRHLATTFEGYAVPAITEAAIERHISRRLDSCSPATVNRELAALKRMLRLGYKLRMVGRVPAISMLAENNARKGFFTEDEVTELLDAARPEIRPLIEAAYITGWRKAELLSRDWRHLDLKAGWLRLEPGETKNNEGRQFPLTSRLRAVLEAQERVRLAIQQKLSCVVMPLFFRYGGKYEGQRIRNFDKEWKTTRTSVGLGERIFHDFRRTAVRNLVRASVPDSVAMALTGHKTRSVFDRYAIVDEGSLREAAVKLERMAGEG